MASTTTANARGKAKIATGRVPVTTRILTMAEELNIVPHNPYNFKEGFDVGSVDLSGLNFKTAAGWKYLQKLSTAMIAGYSARKVH